MASNQDIMTFLLAEKELRTKEKEEERLARTKERQEDMDKIKEMIQTGVKEEVEAAMDPVKDRMLVQEKETLELMY